jgi:hypothetical protein
MTLKDTRKQLSIDKDKYVISTNFYNFLIRNTNSIGDYRKCRAFVRHEISKALSGEVESVRSFPLKKIHIEL